MTEDGAQRRDFIHVTDVARANVAALQADPSVTGPFNVASGTPHTVLDLARALVAAAGPGAPAPVVTGAWRGGDVRHVTASPARAGRPARVRQPRSASPTGWPGSPERSERLVAPPRLRVRPLSQGPARILTIARNSRAG